MPFGSATTRPSLVPSSGYNVLYSFTGGVDGGIPFDSLTLSGSTLYGMTNSAGADGVGTIFSVGTDGSGFTVLYTFTGAADGGDPTGSLTLSGSTLYGMTNQAGADGYGTIFSVGTDGSSFTTLYTFTGLADGGFPSGSLTLSGSTLYGMTNSAGADGVGTVFSVGTDGSGFTVLYTFTGAADGANPNGNLTLSGSTLYGMVPYGGAGFGTIFSIGTDGSNFDTLYSFTGGADASTPYGSLILSGNALYGMNVQRGSANVGTVFEFGL